MKLFEPLKIGTMEVKNRIVMPPMGTMLANPDGTVSERTINYYARRAQGGAGTIIVEIVAVDPHHWVAPQELRIYDDSFLPGLSRLARAIKEHGAKAVVQLHHPGRQCHASVTGHQPVAPSPIPCPLIREMPRQLAVAEIRELVDRFAQGAQRAREAGFDAIELHGAHGYLLCQFLSPFSNQRQDEYGGDLNGRARFPLEIVQAVREKLGRDYPIFFRFSADEHVAGGLTLKETRVLAHLLEEVGVDCLSVSAGNYGAMEWAVQPVLFPKGCLVPLAAAIKKEVKLPVITAGRIIDPDFAEKTLQQGKADLIAIGRGLLADPDLPRKAEQGRSGEIRQCITCMSCQNEVFVGSTGIVCLINPETGREGERETPAPRPKRVLVLGGGPAGLEAARVAALRGHQVSLWDEGRGLGGRWSWLIRGYIAEQTKTLKSLGVKVELGKKIIPETVAAAQPEAVLVTRGTTPAVPPLPGIEGQQVVSADQVLEGKREVSGRVCVLGAGNIGCEVALYLQRRGAQVTLLETSRRVAYGLEMNTRRAMTEELRRKGIAVLTQVKIIALGPNSVAYQDSQGRETSLPSDWVVLATGYNTDDEPLERLKGHGFAVHPLPNCEQPVMAYRVSQEGAAVARQL